MGSFKNYFFEYFSYSFLYPLSFCYFHYAYVGALNCVPHFSVTFIFSSLFFRLHNLYLSSSLLILSYASSNVLSMFSSRIFISMIMPFRCSIASWLFYRISISLLLFPICYFQKVIIHSFTSLIIVYFSS